MNTDLPSTDPIISQFRISPDLMPKMSTPTMAPNYTSIRKFQLALEENALSIQSHQTELGHLALVISEEDYLQANNQVAFNEPTDPGLVPPDPTEGISTRASAEHDVAMLPYTTAATMRTFNFAQQEFFRFKATKAALRNLILNSIDDKYIKTLKNEHTRYAKVSPLALMTHIWDTYGTVDDADQTQNEIRMKQQWNPPTPIETLFEQLEDGKHFAAKGHEVIDDTQLIRWAYDNIKRTGLFDRDCEKWRKKPQADKDWTSFQTFFLEADEDRKKNSTTASEATYTANQVQELLQHEIDSILQATDPPPTTTPPSPPASANASVTADDVRRIIKEALANTRSNNTNRTTNRVETRGTSPPLPPTMCQAIVDGVPVSYCWTHGITRNLQHTSSTCKRKSDGHQDDATYYNRKGGNQNTLGQSSS